MEFQRLNRTDAERVFMAGRNISGAAVSAGVPVEFDIVTVTDGHAFTACKSGSLPGLFFGINDKSCADSADGALVQVYGYRQSAYISQASGAIAAGATLRPVGSVLVSAYSAGIALGYNHVTLLRSTSAKSAGTVDQFAVFVRAM